jgi:glycosyltransferase involved in cell wall biosynthesis
MITLLVEGWTRYIHSYAIVNLMQLVALQKHCQHRFRLIKKEAAPYQSRWETTHPSVMLTAEEDEVFSRIPDYNGEKIDLVYRISFPFDIRGAPANVPIILFYTSEEQMLSNDMFVGGTVQDFVQKCRDGKILPVTPSSWSAEACVPLGIHATVIPHGIHLDVFSPNMSQRDNIRRALHIPSDAFVFLHVGAMTMNKNVSGILEGFVKIAKSNPNVYLLLKGQTLYNSKNAFMGYIQQLTQRGVIQESMLQHLQSHVCLLMKDATSQEMASLYNAADCYIAPYYQEGFNLPVLEALACGLPVIVPDGGPTNDFVPAECSFKIPCSRTYVPTRGNLLQMKQDDIHLAMVRAMQEKRRWDNNLLIRKYAWSNIAEQLDRLFVKAVPETIQETIPEAGPYVSGERLQECADITIMTEHYIPYFRASKVRKRYQILPGDRTTLQEGARVEKHRSYFVYGDLVRSFLERVAPHIHHPFTLFSHNSDENIDDSYAMLIDMVPNLEAWHAVNACFRHPKLHPIPIGIANSMWPHGDLAILDRVCKQGIPKTKLCYFGFRIETNPRARQEAMVLREHYPWVPPVLPYEAYLKELSQHRYCICPAGNGIDTHRFWECVYLGVTPIVIHSTWAEMWRDKIPMVVVDRWLDARPEELTRPYTIQAYRPPASTCVVLVHLGKLANAPYLQDCIHQLRLFYKGDVYLYTDDDDKDVSYPHDVIIVTPKTVPMSDLHRLYMSNNALSDITYRDHFWYHCSRRFLAIHDVVSHFRLSNILHIENDVMMYQDIGVIMDKLQKLGYKIGGTFANPNWVIPGIMYFANWTCTEALARFFEKNKMAKRNDMETIAGFAAQNPEWFTALPVVPADYPLHVHQERMYRPFPNFGMVFDAAALGQYIGGVDPRNIPGDTIGYINPDSEYRFDKERIHWRKSGQLLVPYINEVPICNLHIHSKDLARWSSTRSQATS